VLHEQLGNRNAEALGELREMQDRDIADTALDAAYVATVDFADVCELFLGPLASLPKRTHTSAEACENGVASGLRHPKIVCTCGLNDHGLWSTSGAKATFCACGCP
jgi:hypothetical protein